MSDLSFRFGRSHIIFKPAQGQTLAYQACFCCFCIFLSGIGQTKACVAGTQDKLAMLCSLLYSLKSVSRE